jgi:hypothetical protein
MIMRILMCFVMTICLFSDNVSAKSAGSCGAVFLKIGMSARAAGMGGAFCGLTAGLESLHYNPAGLVSVGAGEVMFMHNQWFEGIRYEYGAYVRQIEGRGVVGADVVIMDAGMLKGYDNNGNKIADFKARDMAVSLCYANRIADNISAGTLVRFIQQKIRDKKASGIGVDIGVMYQTDVDGLSIGASVQNIGQKIKFVDDADSLPACLRVGLAYARDVLIMCVDINKAVDSDVNVHIGIEYQYNQVAFRAGYGTGSEASFSVGAGFGIGSWSIDYAYVPYGDLGDTHRIGVGMKW